MEVLFDFTPEFISNILKGHHEHKNKKTLIAIKNID